MTDKTIKMPKASLEKWLAALRSGEYEQGAEALEHGGRYCCLGVLQYCLTGEVEDNGDGEELPSHQWLREHDITFLDFTGCPVRAPVIPALNLSVAALNDDVDWTESDDSGDGTCVHNYPFDAIADLIEQHAETT